MPKPKKDKWTELMQSEPHYDGEADDLDLIWEQLPVWQKRCLLYSLEKIQQMELAKLGVRTDGQG